MINHMQIYATGKMKNILLTKRLSMRQPDRCGLAAIHHADSQPGIWQQSGFTMLELLVVIAIVGIMAATAAPSFSSFIANSRISSATNDLIADLMQARSQAATSGHHALVCPSTNGTSCSTTVSDWATGRIIFIDKDGSNTFNTGDTLIKYATGLPANLTVTMAGFPNTYIAFNAYGGMFPLGTGSFTLCVKGASQDRQISVDYSGHPAATKTVQSC